MKTVLITICLAFSIACVNASEFFYNKKELTEQMSSLNSLEEDVMEGRISASTKRLSPIMEEGIALSSTHPSSVIDTMDWGAFAWGFCCCPIGFFVLHIPSGDAEEGVKQGFWVGVVVATILNIVSTAVTLAMGGGAYYSYTY